MRRSGFVYALKNLTAAAVVGALATVVANLANLPVSSQMAFNVGFIMALAPLLAIDLGWKYALVPWAIAYHSATRQGIRDDMAMGHADQTVRFMRWLPASWRRWITRNRAIQEICIQIEYERKQVP
jgi:hypothetical protein